MKSEVYALAAILLLALILLIYHFERHHLHWQRVPESTSIDTRVSI